MKKLVAVLAIISFNAHAAPDCREIPSCESLGYICSAEECGDLKALSCPFDTSKKICFPKNKDCEVGDTLYNDFMCHDAPCGKIPIAIVFDTESRLALQLHNGGGGLWGGYGYDIEGLENCGVGDAPVSCGIDGKYNTKTIVEFGKANDLSFPAAEGCYNSTFGGLPQGSWWLPSARELRLLSQHHDTIVAAASKYNVNLGSKRVWTSTECSQEHAHSEWINTGDMSIVGGYTNRGAAGLHWYCVIGY